MTDISTIINRLKKNKKARKSLLQIDKTNAYRLYEKDIPEYPFIIDIYNIQAIVYEKGIRIDETDRSLINLQAEHKDDIKIALQEVMDIQENNIIFKQRSKQKGKDQYTKNSRTNSFFKVHENDMYFKVNLLDYLDSGLFLDHRPLRKLIKNTSKGKKVLNLFSYTGSLSVAAALGGAQVTTIDMSKTYLEWCLDNFSLNDINIDKHEFIQADVIHYLEHEFSNKDNQKYDIILLDPPSFSNSKRMDDFFEIQRDHQKLLDLLMPALRKNGILYFSNNYRKFKMDQEIFEKYSTKDITLKTIPKDFRDLKIHHCFELSNK